MATAAASKRRLAPADDELIALTTAAAARLAGVTERRLLGWESLLGLTPSIRRQLSQRNTVRLYGFTDLLELLVVATLLEGPFTTRQVHRVVMHLRGRGYDRPLSEVRFAMQGREIYFQHSDGTWEGHRRPDQIVMEHVLHLQPLQERIRRAVTHRAKGDAGRVVRHRKVLGNKPVFAGTRIPVDAIKPYLERGLSTAEILEAFPRLTPADIEAARGATGAA